MAGARDWLGALRFVRSQRPRSPADAIDKASAFWRRRHTDWPVPPLSLLEVRLLRLRGRSTAWAVAWAAVNDVLVRIMQDDVRRVGNREAREAALSVLDALRERREEFAMDDELEAMVEAHVAAIVTGA